MPFTKSYGQHVVISVVEHVGCSLQVTQLLPDAQLGSVDYGSQAYQAGKHFLHMPEAMQMLPVTSRRHLHNDLL